MKSFVLDKRTRKVLRSTAKHRNFCLQGELLSPFDFQELKVALKDIKSENFLVEHTQSLHKNNSIRNKVLKKLEGSLKEKNIKFGENLTILNSKCIFKQNCTIMNPEEASIKYLASSLSEFGYSENQLMMEYPGSENIHKIHLIELNSLTRRLETNLRLFLITFGEDINLGIVQLGNEWLNVELKFDKNGDDIPQYYFDDLL